MKPPFGIKHLFGEGLLVGFSRRGANIQTFVGGSSLENKRGAAVRGFHQFHPVLFLASHLLFVLETRPLLGELRYVGGVGGVAPY